MLGALFQIHNILSAIKQIRQTSANFVSSHINITCCKLATPPPSGGWPLVSVGSTSPLIVRFRLNQDVLLRLFGPQEHKGVQTRLRNWEYIRTQRSYGEAAQRQQRFQNKKEIRENFTSFEHIHSLKVGWHPLQCHSFQVGLHVAVVPACCTTCNNSTYESKQLKLNSTILTLWRRQTPPVKAATALPPVGTSPSPTRAGKTFQSDRWQVISSH